MRARHLILLLLACAAPAAAQTNSNENSFQIEWVYKVQYGYQDEWWALYKKYQIATLDREKQLGYVTDYQVYKPVYHVTDEARWDYRIIVTYPSYESSHKEAAVVAQLFPDKTALAKAENRRWQLTVNHWDLPIYRIDPQSDG